MNAAEHLRRRAASYSRDALILGRDGDKAMAAAYRTIANELRQCANNLDSAEEAVG